jgi:uncharacterized protein (DUF885 family)
MRPLIEGLFTASLLLLVACSDNSTTPMETAAPVEVESVVNSSQLETERLNIWLDEQYEQQLDFSPQTRTRLGEKTDNGKLNDYSLEAVDEQIQWRRQSVATMASDFDYDNLTADGKLSYDMWEYGLTQAERALPYANYGYIFGRGGPHAGIPSFMISFHSVDSVEDMQAYIARLKEIDRAFDQLLERSRAAAALGVRPPAYDYDFARGEIARVTAGVPFTVNDSSPNSPVWVDIQGKLDGLVERELIDSEQAQTLAAEARAVLEGEVLDAYQRVLAWIDEDQARTSAEPQGAWAHPDGDNYYNQRLQQMTTLDLTADEIHNIGLSEVARLRAEMEAIKEQVEFEGSLQEFFVFMREDPQFYYPNTQEGREDYLAKNNLHLDFINERLPAFFGRLPKSPLVVRRVEAFREQPGAAQHYRSGSPDGTRPGVFYAHMSDMSTLAIYQIEDIAYHEGNPGHHMQISIQQELTDVPRFRTQYRTTAYTEGWGLYAEWLAKEMGGYQDPYSQFGQLAGDIWRAVRLVVDTGLHAKRWSEDEAVLYFLENSPIPEGAVRSEVKRYISNPGQATAYKIGMLNFQQARARAEAELGDEFDIRAFHDVVLGAGAVPMPVMHTRVDRWIDETLAASN